MRWIKVVAIVALVSGLSARADAQPREEWEVSVVPFYFWAMATDGNLSAGQATVPIFMSFSDATDNLSGAFSFHFEARRGRWGVLTDLNFFRLSSSSTFTLGSRTIEGDVRLDNVMFELGGSYLLDQNSGFAVIGGLRTYTAAPKLEFRGPNTGATPIDSSTTSPNAFAGFVVRPRISDRWTFMARADIGAGDADLTWSALAGFDYRVAPWGSLEFGYKGLGIDTGNDERVLRRYDVTNYGPIFGFRFHWGK